MANQNKNTSIDVALSVLCIVAEYGQTMSIQDIAEVCGCNHSYIGQLSNRAMHKLRKQSELHQIHQFLEE